MKKIVLSFLAMSLLTSSIFASTKDKVNTQTIAYSNWSKKHGKENNESKKHSNVSKS